MAFGFPSPHKVLHRGHQVLYNLATTSKFQAPPLRSQGSALDPGCSPKHWTLWSPAQDYVKQLGVPAIRTRVPNKYPHQSHGCGSWISLFVKVLWWTLQDITLIFHTEFPNPRAPSLGKLVIRTSVLKQLDTLVIRTRLLSSNWTLQLSAQESTSIWTLPLPLTSGHLALGSWLSPQVLSSNWTLWLSAQDHCQATGHSSYPHRTPQVWATRYPRPQG